MCHTPEDRGLVFHSLSDSAFRQIVKSMNRLLQAGLLVVAVVAFTACDTFVEQVREPTDTQSDESFNQDTEARFLIQGVQAQFADASDLTLATSDFLSDQFRFGLNGEATFPTFGQLDRGRPQLRNNSVDAALNAVGQYRFLADSLLGRADVIEFDTDATASETEMRYVGHLHGAMARYYLATYFGESPRRGGSVINQSSFIRPPQMYQRASNKFDEALSFAQQLGDDAFVSSARAQKIVQSLRARAALFAGTHDFQASGGLQGNAALQQAAQYAAQGLKPGDDEFEIPYSTQDPNEYADQAGRERIQMVAQDGVLFNETVSNANAYRRDAQGAALVRSWIFDVILSNPKELARVPLASVRGGPSFTDGSLTPKEDGSRPDDITLWLQGLEILPSDGDPPELGSDAPLEFAQDRFWQGEGAATPTGKGTFPVMSWQENHLMRAELELRGFDTGNKTATELINEVRNSFSSPGTSRIPFGVDFDDLDPADVDLNRLAIERDRTLSFQGVRLPDQRRLEVPSAEWHLNENVGGGTTWQWLPVTTAERNANPNV